MTIRISHPPIDPWVFVQQVFDDSEYFREKIPGTNTYYQAIDASSGETFHCGQDLQDHEGAPLYAPADGRVELIHFGEAYGIQTALRTASSGLGGGCFFAHQRARVGKFPRDVEASEQIGEMGHTSSRQIGTHLHYAHLPVWNVARFENPSPELRRLKEVFMAYTKEKDALLDAILTAIKQTGSNNSSYKAFIEHVRNNAIHTPASQLPKHTHPIATQTGTAQT